MSEETHDAALRGPLAIRVAVLVSGVLGWVLTVSMCFCIRDLDAVLHSPTGMPAAQIFLDAGGRVGGTIMWFFVILVQFFTGCSAMLADTRMAYAFARDEALPFSKYSSPPPFPLPENTHPLGTNKWEKISRQNQLLHPHPRQRRLVRRLFQRLPRPHCHRLHRDRHRHLQRDRPGAGRLVHRGHCRASTVQAPRPFYRGALQSGSLAGPHQLHLRDLGRVYQHRTVLPAHETDYAREYELCNLRGGVYCRVFINVVVDFGEKVWFPISVFSIKLTSGNRHYTGPRTKTLIESLPQDDEEASSGASTRNANTPIRPRSPV